MSIQESWNKSDISPCCNWYSNKTASKTGSGHKCCKCGKDW